ncbi:MAG TPA: S9 family peptidase [Propioniciclava tarda]|mgnify:CR=1 FL=1|nr:S9 family peptidase [Propioniciclava tarda]
MRPDHLPLLPSVSAPQVHPDGTWAVVAASYPSLDADAYVGQLWRIDLRGAEPPRRLTRGKADAAPQFSPGGSLIGFLRAPADGRPQVHVIPAAGGEPVQATDAKLGVGEFTFAPDERLLAFTARTPEEGRYGTLDGVGASAEDARRITTLQFQSNGLGWTNDRRRQLFVTEVPDPYGEPFVEPKGRAAKALADAKLAAAASDLDTPLEVPGAVRPATQLTRGDFDHSDPTFVPDGTLLAASSRHDERDLDLLTEVFAFDLTPDAEPRPIAPGLNAYEACGAADGATTFLIGADLGDTNRDFVGRLGGVFALDASGQPRRLTDAQTVQVEHGLTPFGSDGVLTIVNERGTTRPLTVRADGTVTTWPTGEASVLGAAEIPGDPTRIVVTLATPDSPPEVGILDASGALTVLTDFSGRLRAASPGVRPIELTATASDGYAVHGWVYVPAGDGPHPVLLNIHGGPHSTYGPAFFDEFQVYADAGYAVVACNPRGSGGYGEHHGRVIKDAMGDLDASDILSFLDHALASVPGLDASRVGVQGGSYGGYMTAWLIGHTDRFAAAIVERGFLDTESFIGHSDIGWFFVEEYNGTDAAHRATQSPMSFASEVRTPTLVIHSEDDLRCPLGPALRYYTTLKLNKVDAELLVFPGENHELSRSGTPHHRKQRFEAILDWWGRHLPLV